MRFKLLLLLSFVIHTTLAYETVIQKPVFPIKRSAVSILTKPYQTKVIVSNDAFDNGPVSNLLSPCLSIDIIFPVCVITPTNNNKWFLFTSSVHFLSKNLQFIKDFYDVWGSKNSMFQLFPRMTAEQILLLMAHD